MHRNTGINNIDTAKLCFEENLRHCKTINYRNDIDVTLLKMGDCQDAGRNDGRNDSK